MERLMISARYQEYDSGLVVPPEPAAPYVDCARGVASRYSSPAVSARTHAAAGTKATIPSEVLASLLPFALFCDRPPKLLLNRADGKLFGTIHVQPQAIRTNELPTTSARPGVTCRLKQVVDDLTDLVERRY
jgi:hypothetical protein